MQNSSIQRQEVDLVTPLLADLSKDFLETFKQQVIRTQVMRDLARRDNSLVYEKETYHSWWSHLAGTEHFNESFKRTCLLLDKLWIMKRFEELEWHAVDSFSEAVCLLMVEEEVIEKGTPYI